MSTPDHRSSVATHTLRDKLVRFQRIRAEATGFGLTVDEVDDRRPWGGFVKFAHDSLGRFLDAYWKTFLSDYWRDLLVDYVERARMAEPVLQFDAKLLLVAPGERLSLQSHARRSELWRVLEGPVMVVTGSTEENVDDREVRPGEVVRIQSGHLHRLAAPHSGWGVIAEIWLHEDAAKPSDEYDIRRYDDDYWMVER